MLLGYARVSPADLNPDHQVDTLRRAGVAAEDTYIDHASGAKASRPQLDLVLKLLRDGDHAGDHATRPPRQVGAAPDHSRRRAARARGRAEGARAGPRHRV
ncbi:MULTISPECIES: recombinase family protein [Rhodococcus]|uniref:recombinase family protein n=1 Tax=Rhodococcus TaxID=1827 RepID=UPI001E4CEFD7|nr:MULTISPECIES: recombinase family protein [Rhodococcus]